MPVLESTNEITPKSVLRHRPIGDKTAKTEKESATPSTNTTPVAQRASRLRPNNTDASEDVSEWQREEDDETRTGRKTSTPGQVDTSSQKLPKAPNPGRIRSKRKFWHGDRKSVV